ncbi:YkvA family protein [Streptomyces sp. HU2014]|uniref:DUF1232 domain-containing protein n=1 Tax=Streptomyces sp. HU2014 TaxID=2939414 RepID=UPI00200EF4C9|nr:YkvA family protein [Streptomyces sp. HU2014]UQI45875.1 YkvA family protein [Streptomyces sp. HU2014]
MAAAGAAVLVALRLIRARRLLRQAGVPETTKLVFRGALLYLVSPRDLIPDPFYVDDIGVLLLALCSLRTAARSPAATSGPTPLR